MPASVIEAAFPAERGKLLASLIRWARNFDDAEDVLSEALLEAHQHWSQEVPENPGAWLLTVAKRKLLDRRRIEKRRRELLARHFTPPLITDSAAEEELPDDILRLIFTCCHPVLAPESRIALTLRALGGLATGEIARAFLVEESTMAQRLVRAKRKIALAGIRYAVPETRELPERLSSVLQVLYLIFNEAYAATEGDTLQRPDLAREAIRLAASLTEWLPEEAEAAGLHALLCLTHARRDARVDSRGRLVTLDRQDRSLWTRDEIGAAGRVLEKALRRKQLGPYQLQAAIMAVHCEAPTAAQTDWRQIVLLYEELRRFDDSPTVQLNAAVAVAHARSWAEAEPLLRKLEGLDGYYPFHAARAHCALALGRPAEARAAFQRALSLTRNAVERDYLNVQLQAVLERSPDSAS
jgi:RNA polymerase sigma-70 factor, ECF subfamily